MAVIIVVAAIVIINQQFALRLAWKNEYSLGKMVNPVIKR
jgi:hypothetical protein